MITVTETRQLTLYLCDADGQPVRAAVEDDLRGAGWRRNDEQVTCSHCCANVAVAYAIQTEQDREIERLRARLAAWEPVVREAISCGCMGMASMALSKAVDLLPQEHTPETTP